MVSTDESDVEHFHWRVTKNLTRRIDQYLVDRVGYLSRAGVQRIIGDGLVKVNGRVIKSSYHPRDGDEIDMVAPPEPVNELVPEAIPLDIVYEDEYFLALNKQANLIVHPRPWRVDRHAGQRSGPLRKPRRLPPAAPSGARSMATGVPAFCTASIAHTTGIMLVAKSDEAHWRLARQFENRTIQKTYLAFVHGVPDLLGDVIDMPIGQDRYVREKQAIRKIENGGRVAVTKYEVQQVHQSSAEIAFLDSAFANDRKLPPPPGRFSFVKLSPKTGLNSPASRSHVCHRPSDGRRLNVWRSSDRSGRLSASSGRRCMPLKSASLTLSRSSK